MKLALLTCLWQRHDLSDIVLGWYASLVAPLQDQGITLTCYAAGSEGIVSQGVAERNGFVYTEVPNKPLGAKWNAVLQRAKQDDPDAVVIVGSDDLLSGTAFLGYRDGLQRGKQFLGLLDMHFYDAKTKQAIFWPGYEPPRAGETAGLGRCIHRDLLTGAKWRLWDGRVNVGLDRSMMQILKPHLSANNTHTFQCLRDGIGAVDIKTSVNIWPFAHLASVPYIKQANAEDAFLFFPHDIKQRIDSLCQ